MTRHTWVAVGMGAGSPGSTLSNHGRGTEDKDSRSHLTVPRSLLYQYANKS